jgi:hypothetical protein
MESTVGAFKMRHMQGSSALLVSSLHSLFLSESRRDPTRHLPINIQGMDFKYGQPLITNIMKAAITNPINNH